MASDSMLSAPATRSMARELASIRRDLDAVKSGQVSTQMDYSSIMGPLYVRDPVTGDYLGAIGLQPDGGVSTIPVGGPPPPALSTPILTPGIHTVTVEWDGNFAGGVARPSNFAFGAVHASQAGANFITDPSNLVATLTEAGTVPIGPYEGPVWVRFVGYNTSTPSVTGPASATATATPNQVVAQSVLDGIVTETKLADQAVAANKVKLGAIGTGQLAGNSVTTAQLASGAVDAEKLAPAAVTTPKIAPLAVTGAELAASSVVAGKVAANAITAGTIDANAVTATTIAADAVTASHISANSIGTSELAANSVVAGKIGADAVTANEILANSIGAEHLVAGSVQAGKIAANAVTANEILAGAVTAGKIATNAVTAGTIAAGAVTATKLEATLAVVTRLYAGSLTGTRAEINSSGFEAWKGSLKTFDVDAATGDVMLLGAYKTADTGARVELGGANGADVIRFYQTSTIYAYLNAESAPNSTAALVGRSQTVNSRLGAFGCYPTEAFIALQSSGGTSLSAVSALDGALNIWSNSIVSLHARNTSGRVDFLHDASSAGMRLEYRKSGGNNEPQLFCPQRNIAATWATNFLYIGDGVGNPQDVVAKNVVASSSRRAKKGERDPVLERAANARDALGRIKVRQFNYTHEWVEGEPEPPRVQHTRRRPKTDAYGRVMVDDAGVPIEEEEVFEALPPPKARRHFGVMAEDLLSVLPEVVIENADLEGGLGIVWNDVIGYLMLVNTEQEQELRALRADVDGLRGPRGGRG